MNFCNKKFKLTYPYIQEKPSDLKREHPALYNMFNNVRSKTEIF